MAVKKSEIYRSLWASCDQLRGGMDASQYKDYILVLLFMKYVSDRYAGDPSALIEVPEGGSFADMTALKGDKEIGDKINVIIARLAEANDLKGVIDIADFNDTDKLGRGNDMVNRLSTLIAIFNRPELDFSKNRAEGDDILGDAYEYLMRNFATDSGKSKGQFYTPAEVSIIMAKVIRVSEARSAAQTIYDPTCGSGSLLLKAHADAPYDLTLYGQEMDSATRALSTMNMILHDCPTAEIWQDNTLSTPHFKNNDGSLKTFDFVVANPPFSSKAWASGLNPEEDEFKRFEYGIPPAKNGDYAFLLHVLTSLKSTGKGAIILPHGVLFRGNVEAQIRKRLIRQGFIRGIIGLPANLFYGTGIPACIVVLGKEYAASRTGIFMIDASKGFFKDGSKNRLRAQDIHKIVDAFTKETEIDKYARMVPLAEIEANDYNLNIPRYIDSTEPEDLHDIEAHLKGGIPDRDVDGLRRYWDVMPGLRVDLFIDAKRPGYSALNVETAGVTPTIFEHPEFTAFSTTVSDAFKGWKDAHLDSLRSMDVGVKPKDLIGELSEDLLACFKPVALIDAYDVFQHLMAYWSDVMQDDVYLIAAEGWDAGRQVRELVKNAEGKFTETPDLIIGKRKLKAELIPPALIIARFFAVEQTALEALEAKAEELKQSFDEMIEEHSGEDGLLVDALNDNGKFTAASANARIKEIKQSADVSLTAKEKIINAAIKQGTPLSDKFKRDFIENDGADFLEFIQIKEALDLLDQLTKANKAVKEAKTVLDKATLGKYRRLTDDEIKTLTIEDKWMATLNADIKGELDRVSQSLARRIKTLADRYADPLPKLANNIMDLTSKVDAHLKKMGFTW